MSASSGKPAAAHATLPSSSELVARASGAIFGKPLVVNVWRALLVESLMDFILPLQWTWCAADYAGWDFQHVDGTRLELKQSAARQSWKASAGRPATPRFDIATRTGAWDGATWNRATGRTRYADLYVLAYHPVADDTADHRDPRQWLFHVIPTACLPATQTISLPTARRLATQVGATELSAAVEKTRLNLRHDRNAAPAT